MYVPQYVPHVCTTCMYHSTGAREGGKAAAARASTRVKRTGQGLFAAHAHGSRDLHATGCVEGERRESGRGVGGEWKESGRGVEGEGKGSERGSDKGSGGRQCCSGGRAALVVGERAVEGGLSSSSSFFIGDVGFLASKTVRNKCSRAVDSTAKGRSLQKTVLQRRKGRRRRKSRRSRRSSRRESIGKSEGAAPGKYRRRTRC